MININDEILNKYLDAELSSEEISKVKTAINSDPKLTKRYNALKLVHQNLKSVEADSVSEDFTRKLMQIIGRKVKVPKQQKFFVLSIVVFISLLSLLVVGFVIGQIIAAAPAGSGSISVMESVDNYSVVFIKGLKGLFSGKSLSIIGSIFSLIIIISGYFFFEFKKKATANLSS